MRRSGFLIYGARMDEGYCGCDAYGYAYNEICQNLINEADERNGYLSEPEALKGFGECGSKRLSVNVLFCKVTDEESVSSDDGKTFSGLSMRFLGYDIAWTEYDFYSSVLHDVLSAYGELRDQAANLNQQGLFSKYAQAKKYLSLRTKCKSKDMQGRFEEGKFHIVAIWECVNEA